MNDYVPELGDLPQQFDRYRILRRIGKGGMGAVYLATDTQLDRLVAIKVPYLSGSNDTEVLRRFHQEAAILAQLNHPNLCTVYDAAECNGIHYLTMRYIEGEPLRRRRDAYKGRRAVILIETLARAIAVVHEAHIVHRDLKPENVIIDLRGQPVIVDFGLALFRDDTDTRSTQPGTVKGTVTYMAPEQQAGNIAAVGSCQFSAAEEF